MYLQGASIINIRDKKNMNALSSCDQSRVKIKTVCVSLHCSCDFEGISSHKSCSYNETESCVAKIEGKKEHEVFDKTPIPRNTC